MLPKKKDNSPFIVLGIVFYLILIILSLHSGKAMHENYSLTILNSIPMAMSSLLSDPMSCFPIEAESWQCLKFFTLFYVIIVAFLVFDIQRNKRDAIGKEKGDAKWNTDMKAYNKKYTYPPDSAETYEPTEEEKVNNHEIGNMILSKNVYLNMNTRQTRVNDNVLIIGAAGKGKSRFVVKPNILQANCSYVITDPSGELLESTGMFLKNQGYKIKVFNLCDMTHSNCYNPFYYMRDDAGVMMLINCLIKNTNKEGQSGGDPFWEKSETALLQALIFYLIKYCPPEEQNFVSVMKLLDEAEVNENNPNAKSPLDIRFEALEKLDPGSIALKQYKIFKRGAGKTLKSILISVSVRLSHFNIPQVANLTSTDNLNLKALGDEKQALFVIIPAADDTYKYL